MSLSLTSSVEAIYGIGQANAVRLSKLGIGTVDDLINYLPVRYDDWHEISPLFGLYDGQEISFKAHVMTSPTSNGYGRKAIISFNVSDGSGTVKLSFFNMSYLMSSVHKGDSCFVHGKVSSFAGRAQLVNPVMILEDKFDGHLIKPVYSLTDKITSRNISKWESVALKAVEGQLEDIIPSEFSRINGLCTPEEAYRYVHFPETFTQAASGKLRLIYEELVLLGIGIKRLADSSAVSEKAVKICSTKESLSKLKTTLEGFPFELTDDQKSTVNDIFKDLSTGEPMNRLIQGDVGSGKTAIAAVVACAVAFAGKQTVMMAPTSVLASQHFETITELLKNSGINIVLLLGGMKASEKKTIKEQIRNGYASLIIGTHAVLSDDIEFNNLALVITDEQHRFGVKQRSKLLHGVTNEDGANTVHSMVMTATPIPRTLAMIIYGDMKISEIRHKPEGRQKIATGSLGMNEENKLYGFLNERLSSGEQVYIVCPKISEDEAEEGEEAFLENYEEYDDDNLQLMSVSRMLEMLKTSGLSQKYAAEGLFGPMKEKDKTAIMERFAKKETQILVSTTVIEVGVNNPNATVMVIMNADRFGLSTLHQLRGRVGRGTKKSYCLLMTDSKSHIAEQRIHAMCTCDDGFVLAQRDLEIRGPGDFFGTRQHGIPTLRAANLFEDADKAAQVCDAVREVLEKNDEEARILAEKIDRVFKQRFGDKMNTFSL